MERKNLTTHKDKTQYPSSTMFLQAVAFPTCSQHHLTGRLFTHTTISAAFVCTAAQNLANTVSVILALHMGQKARCSTSLMLAAQPWQAHCASQRAFRVGQGHVADSQDCQGIHTCSAVRCLDNRTRARKMRAQLA